MNLKNIPLVLKILLILLLNYYIYIIIRTASLKLLLMRINCLIIINRIFELQFIYNWWNDESKTFAMNLIFVI